MKELLVTLLSALATAIGGTLAAWILARTRSGRLVRTFDYAERTLGFVKQCSERYDSLAKVPQERRNELENLLQSTVTAVQEDFLIERSLLPNFTRHTTSIRSGIIVGLPRHGILWFPYIFYYTLLFFAIYLVAVRLVQFFTTDQLRWTFQDTLVLLGTCILATIIRLLLVRVSPG